MKKKDFCKRLALLHMYCSYLKYPLHTLRQVRFSVYRKMFSEYRYIFFTYLSANILFYRISSFENLCLIHHRKRNQILDENQKPLAIFNLILHRGGYCSHALCIFIDLSAYVFEYKKSNYMQKLLCGKYDGL